jgi:AcrR family transcriptional regulator
MTRWDPGTEERLEKAALELFYEHGYDSVTVTQIAERAGVVRRSFFRYFPDKREVLFAGSEKLPPAIAEAVLAASKSTPPLSAVLEAMTEVGTLLTQHIKDAAKRRTIIDASTELQEREQAKLAAVTAAISEALAKRHVAPQDAKMVAEIGTIVFQNAFAQWVAARGKKDFGSCIRTLAVALQQVVSATLTKATR